MLGFWGAALVSEDPGALSYVWVRTGLSVPLPPFAKRMVGRGQGWGALVLSG
jgi:hypothetical protein